MHITKRDLKLLTEGETPLSMSGIPFAIIRSSISARGITQNSWQWELATSPDGDDIIEIDRKTAVSIIHAQDMHIAISRPYGQIYEQDGKPFLKSFANKSSIAS